MDRNCIAYNRHEGSGEKRGELSIAMINRLDASAKYAEHYSNAVLLGYILKRGTVDQKCRASTELALCERKMTYWKNRPNWTIERATQLCGAAHVRIRETLRKRGVTL
jgi:hypothetical protein